MFVLKGILRAESQEKILIYLLLRESGYGKQISDFFRIPANPVQKQLVKLEEDGVLAGYSVGRTRIYSLNPRYLFLGSLKALLKDAVSVYPPDLINELLLPRTRPRQAGKPLTEAHRRVKRSTET